MKYALVGGKKTEAYKAAKGICPSCESELIAKCGEIKLHHWAHKSIRSCDSWWENETEWHRSWKNLFPSAWQEIPFPDKATGERHIADVFTVHGLVIEFQHSKIETQERTSREKFYKNMVWVVDGTRLKGDYPRFLKGRNYFHNTKKPNVFLAEYPETCFPLAWLESSVPVIFDFRGTELLNDIHDRRNQLYCLFPKRNKRGVYLVEISRESFVKNTIDGVWFTMHQEQQKQSLPPPVIKRIVIRKREVTHYYDPRQGRFVKRRRF
jgi:competence protein CoiA